MTGHGQYRSAKPRQEYVADVKSIKHPMLVRVMNDSDVLPGVGDRSNTQSSSRMPPVEQAANDITRVNTSQLEFTETGEPTRATAQQFVHARPVSECGDMMNKEGTPTFVSKRVSSVHHKPVPYPRLGKKILGACSVLFYFFTQVCHMNSHIMRIFHMSGAPNCL